MRAWLAATIGFALGVGTIFGVQALGQKKPASPAKSGDTISITELRAPIPIDEREVRLWDCSGRGDTVVFGDEFCSIFADTRTIQAAVEKRFPDQKVVGVSQAYARNESWPFGSWGGLWTVYYVRLKSKD